MNIIVIWKEIQLKKLVNDDSVCVEECNAYKKLVRDPRHADRDIPGFNGRYYHNNLKQILLADVTNKVYNILNEIKF